jgi:hypothetical protein
MENKILNILKETLPELTHIIVNKRKSCFGGEYLQIGFSASDHQINMVKYQYPQLVTLDLNLETLELHPQVFGGNGGQHIYRKPDMLKPNEGYLAMKAIKIPFRKPKNEEKFVLSAIEKFAKNWVKILRENKDKLMYHQYVDYNKLLDS